MTDDLDDWGDDLELEVYLVTWRDEGGTTRASLVWAESAADAWRMAGKPEADPVWVVPVAELEAPHSMALALGGTLPIHWVPPLPSEIH